MKTPLALFLGFALAAPLAFAQAPEPAMPGPAAAGEKPREPMSLMPEMPPLHTTPGAPAADEPAAPLTPPLPDSRMPARKPSKTLATEEELKARIRFREVKTRALEDPAVQGEWERAHAAKTDPERREAFHAYYTRLFARMLKLDGSLAERIEAHKKLTFARIDQTRREEETVANKKLPAGGVGSGDE